MNSIQHLTTISFILHLFYCTQNPLIIIDSLKSLKVISSQSNMDPSTVLTTPKSSLADLNEYRVIQLPNGLIAILISENRQGSEPPHWHHRPANELGLANISAYPTGRPSLIPSFRGMDLQSANIVGRRPIFNSFINNSTSIFPSTFPELLSTADLFPNLGSSLLDDLQRRGTNSLVNCSGGEGDSKDEHQPFDYKNVHNDSDYNDAQAYCALTVNVGSVNDPKSHNGLAHFCEHMVHYGSKKFMDEDVYFKWIIENGREVNAFTQNTTTTYHFSTFPSHFDTALDIFSSMMAEPLFRQDCVKREVIAVDNEFALKEHHDVWRRFDMLSLTVKDGHPLKSFMCGNYRSLLKDGTQNQLNDLTKQLKKFHKEYYVASGMTLAIHSSLSLDDMEKMVTEKFSKIPRGNRNIRRFTQIPPELQSPYDTNDFFKMYLMKSKHNHRMLSINWHLPAEAWKDYKNKPLEFLEFLLSNEWHGGLSNRLRSSGWIIDVSIGCHANEHYRSEFCSLFEIAFVMTDSGVDNLDLVLKEVYSGIQTIRDLSLEIKRNFWDEAISVSKHHFRHSGPGQGTSFTISCARLLQILPEKDIFENEGYPSGNYDDVTFMRYLEMLKPNKMNVMLSLPKDHPKLPRKRFEINPITKAEYLKSKLNPKLIADLHKAKPFQDILKKKFEKCPYFDGRNVASLGDIRPQQIFKEPKLFLTHQGNRNKEVFKANCMIRFITPYAKYNQMNGHMLSIWGQCLSLLLLPDSSELSRAGIEFTMTVVPSSLLFNFVGFPNTLAPVIRNMMTLAMDEYASVPLSTFNVVKNTFIQKYNDQMGNVGRLAREVLQELIMIDKLSFQNDLNILRKITHQDMERFSQLFKSSSMGICNISGNMSIREAKDIGKILLGLDYAPRIGDWRRALDVTEMLNLPAINRCIRVSSNQRACINTNVSNVYQFGKDRRINVPAILDFVAHLMKAPSFFYLRTFKQLGYTVGVNMVIPNPPTLSVSVTCQSSRFSACHIDQEIDTFLNKFYELRLKNMTVGEFEEQKRLWNFFEELNLNEIKNWYEKHILSAVHINQRTKGPTVWKSVNRTATKISIQILGKDDESCMGHEECGKGVGLPEERITQRDIDQVLTFAQDKEDEPTPYFIHDVSAFRDSIVRKK